MFVFVFYQKGGPSQRQQFGSNDLDVTREPETLDLRPQWSLQNDDSYDGNQEPNTDSQRKKFIPNVRMCMCVLCLLHYVF